MGRPVTRAGDGQGGEPDTRFILEAHYYTGGLRVKRLGSAAERPSWLPSGEAVGIQNEIALQHYDVVVEFARFTAGKKRLTWIGVFSKSVDGVFGDRENYAGIGVWLVDADAIHALRLIRGLNLLATSGNIEQIEKGATAFLTKYLPTYIRAGLTLPGAFAGWPYSETVLSESRLLLACGTTIDEAWNMAAEQILRMSFLPDPACSRALILLRVSDEGGARETGLEPVKPGVATDVLALLPDAISQTMSQNREMKRTIDALNQRSGQVEGSLRAAREENKALKTRGAELERQLNDNDILKRLTAIETRLRQVDTQTQRAEAAIGKARDEIADCARKIQSGRDLPGNLPPRVPPPGPAVAEDDERPDFFDKLFGFVFNRTTIGIVLGISIIILLIIFVSTRLSSAPESLDGTIAPSIPERFDRPGR